MAFLLAHIVVTVVPVPRTAFTLAAGLLFGPVLGVVIAVAASAASAVLAVLLVRAAGWQLNRLVRHRAVDKVDERLRNRGWRAVLSLRLIPVVPFAALNYAAGASAVRLMPYTLATLAGLLPGTAAVVILGDALAGHVSPMLYLISVCTGALGLTGLFLEIRHYRLQHHKSPHDGPAVEFGRHELTACQRLVFRSARCGRPEPLPFSVPTTVPGLNPGTHVGRTTAASIAARAPLSRERAQSPALTGASLCKPARSRGVSD